MKDFANQIKRPSAELITEPQSNREKNQEQEKAKTSHVKTKRFFDDVGPFLYSSSQLGVWAIFKGRQPLSVKIWEDWPRVDSFHGAMFFLALFEWIVHVYADLLSVAFFELSGIAI